MTITTKLSDLQLILLATAAQRVDGSLLPPPDSVPDHRGRIGKSVASLIKRGLADEREVSDPALSWSSEGDQLIGATINNRGRAAIGVEVPAAPPLDPGHTAVEEPPQPASPEQPAVVAPAASPREGSKQALVLGLLSREQGATLAELVAATGWLPHTTRAALTGLRKKGCAISKSTHDDATCYHVTRAGA